MKRDEVYKGIEDVVEGYIQSTRNELEARWKNWPLDLEKHELHEVIGALLARHVTLANQLAVSPYAWNEHIAPLILRAMLDAHIALAWILENPLERSRKFILHGLGQKKLLLEHRKAELKEMGKDPATDDVVKTIEEWINSQQWTFITEVNVGNWAGLTTRKMAEEVGLLNLYNTDYQSFSGTVHNMWQHIGVYNLKQCNNPLHRYHMVPSDNDGNNNPYFLLLAARYVRQAFDLFDSKTGVKVDVPDSLNVFKALMDNFSAKLQDSNPESGSNTQDNLQQ